MPHEDLTKLQKAPNWILVVEKYAVYERLMKSKYGIDDGGLVLTGHGVPDRATQNRGQFIRDKSFNVKNTGILSR